MTHIAFKALELTFNRSLAALKSRRRFSHGLTEYLFRAMTDRC
jgi:hypothetical protein